MTRGANFTAFATVSNAKLIAGRKPKTPGEAVIGADLASSLGVDVNETLFLGGSTRPAVVTLRIVGIYQAPGIYDDQVIVPLQTARLLAGVRQGSVHIIRVDSQLPDLTSISKQNQTPGTAIVTTAIDVPTTVRTTDQFTVRVRLQNIDSVSRTRNVSVRFSNRMKYRTVRIQATSKTTVTFKFTAPSKPGTYRLSIENQTRTIHVADKGLLRLSPIPDRGPPNATLLVTVVDGDGTAISNVTIRIGSKTTQTGA
ncbi:MAG: ABC transporter permease, partial [Halobacteriaceae archaeon]